MKLEWKENNGNVFTTDLPRGRSKHRVPEMGCKIKYTDDSKTHYGVVYDVSYSYTQVLGDLRSADITIYVKESNWRD